MAKVCKICGGPYYAKDLCEKHYMKAYMKAYRKPASIPVIDCFERDKPVTLETLCAKSEGGRGYVIRALRDFQKIGLVIKIEKNVFQLNPDSPFRKAVDGYYFQESKRKTKK
jgi:hypothetical protein